MRPRSRPTAPRLLPTALAVLAGFAAGSVRMSLPDRLLPEARADGHNPAANPAGVKAPVAEVLHCPLAFAGVHLQKDRPANARVAYHFCKALNDDVSQCLLYDGTGPGARLIGVEYLVGDATYRAMPEAEQAFWHDHEFEVDSGLLRSLVQRGDEERATLAKVRTLHGKIFHTWVEGRAYPEGPARLFWSATGKPPFVLGPGAAVPPEVRPGADTDRP